MHFIFEACWFRHVPTDIPDVSLHGFGAKVLKSGVYGRSRFVMGVAGGESLLHLSALYCDTRGMASHGDYSAASKDVGA